MLGAGTIVGEKYRLEVPIGEGGMATVWRAVHTTLDRPVAVKFLEVVGAGSRQAAARFLEEAKLAAGLRHRHVVDILDFGVADGGKPFMVMELLEGQSLADRYADGPVVSDFELLEIVAMTLGGLGAVHDAGILHRDVKPENIFLVEDADGVYPKLLDFGISRGFGTIGRVTRSGIVVGTPQYMSPEQARGKKDLDARSDLWSAGVVLYEGFAGQVPFDSENPGDVLIMVATEEPLPLSELRPDLPPSVIELVHRALSKRPSDRFESARAMRETVLRILESEENLQGRPSLAVMRTAYSSTRGSGKLRALSAPPPAEPSSPTLEMPGAVDDRMPSERPAARPSAPSSSSSWGVLLVALALAAAGGYWAFAGHLGLPAGVNREVDPESAGAVRPGEPVVPDVAAEMEISPSPLEPPPEDGVPAPPTATLDVPSPPDPPDRAPEERLGDVVDDADVEPEPVVRRSVRRRRAAQ